LRSDHSSVGRRKATESAWLVQSLHTVVCAGKGNGSLLFHAFPQEIIDKVAGRPVVHRCKSSSPSWWTEKLSLTRMPRFSRRTVPNRDGSTHERKIFLLQISKKGEVLMDGNVVDRIQPFPMRYGSGTIRDGKLVFR